MGIGNVYGIAEFPDFLTWRSGAPRYGSASGGTSSTITVGGKSYTLLTFTSDGTLTVSKAGLFDVLLVGGGGGGGGNAGNVINPIAIGGGGGGQVITSTIYLNSGTYTVDVGAGGAGGTRNDGGASVTGQAGNLSSIGTAIFAGGGDGCGGGVAGGGAARMSGTGGSAAGSQYGEAQSKRTPLIGANLGGTNGANTNAGGGGGAGGAGGNGSSTTGGTGGNGTDISTFIAGSSYFAGAGGAGGASGTGGTAGSGGVAGKTSGSGNSGVNYGAGGGGTYANTELNPAGGAGAAGAVYVRFL